jgi:GIY-YIG catalytic domain
MYGIVISNGVRNLKCLQLEDVYLLTNGNNKVMYVGVSNNLERRIFLPVPALSRTDRFLAALEMTSEGLQVTSEGLGMTILKALSIRIAQFGHNKLWDCHFERSEKS